MNMKPGPLIVFAVVCVVLAFMAHSIENPDIAVSAVGAVAALFFIGLLAYEGRVGWLQQHQNPRQPQFLCLRIVLATLAIVIATQLRRYIPLGAWYRLPVSLLGFLGIVSLVHSLGALVQHLGGKQ